MIINNITKCPICGGNLKHYDRVERVVRIKGGLTQKTKIKRVRCITCRKLHRELPDYLVPYKHYEAEIIKGVIDGYITTETLGFEDYPCELTMKRWCSR